MKTFFLYLISFFIFMTFFSGCVVTIIGDIPASTAPSFSIIQIVSASLVTIYELVVRIVPTIANYSAVGFIINILKKLSDTLNVEK